MPYFSQSRRAPFQWLNPVHSAYSTDQACVITIGIFLTALHWETAYWGILSRSSKPDIRWVIYCLLVTLESIYCHEWKMLSPPSKLAKYKQNMEFLLVGLQVPGVLVSMGSGWRVTEHEHKDFCSCFIDWQIDPSTEEDLLLFPPQFHNPFPGNKKRCVLITQHWCNTQGRPPSHQTYTQPQRETHTTFCPCSCERFCQKIRGRLPNRATPSLRANRRESDRFQNKSRQQNSTAEKVASALGQPPPLPKKKKKKWFTPPKNRVFLHGWFEEAQVCCVFPCKMCVCMSQRE